MKQKEFEWLKLWLYEVLHKLHPNFREARLIAALEVVGVPPPIDKTKQEFVCPECGKPALGIGGEGAYYKCMNCNKTWDFDWENRMVLDTSDITNVTCLMPGMKERKEEPKSLLEALETESNRHERLREQESKPDLKVGIAGAHCNTHDADFISKDGHYYCPECFPEGFAEIDKRNLQFYARCIDYRVNQSDLCPCCGEVKKRPAP